MPQRKIHHIQNIGSQHRNLINDNNLNFAEEFQFVFAVFEMGHQVSNIIGQITVDPVCGRKKGTQGQPKHRMNCNPAGINRSNSGRCHYNVFLAGLAHKIVEKSGFPGAGLSGKKNAAAGMFC